MNRHDEGLVMLTNTKLCVLVMGVGGNIGQGILKSLSISGIAHRVIGACVSPLACGLYFTDSSYVSPYHNEPNFLEWLIEVCRKEKVDVILTGVEPVLWFLAQHQDQIKKATGALCITSDPATLLIANDKFLTCQWLQENGFNYPHYALSSDDVAVGQLVQTCHFPLIGKPRYGRGGAGIIKIHDQTSLQLAMAQKDYLIQEYIGNPDAEYTVGCFSNRDGKVCGSISMKRELLEGTTLRAIVGNFPEINAEAVRIVAALKANGPCNVQLRMSSSGLPVCFEINMRFSGTTPIRAHFGFNEVKAALEHFVLDEEEIQLPFVTSGIALRYWNEAYIETAAHALLETTGKLANPQQYHLSIENYGRDV